MFEFLQPRSKRLAKMIATTIEKYILDKRKEVRCEHPEHIAQYLYGYAILFDYLAQSNQLLPLLADMRKAVKAGRINKAVPGQAQLLAYALESLGGTNLNKRNLTASDWKDIEQSLKELSVEWGEDVDTDECIRIGRQIVELLVTLNHSKILRPEGRTTIISLLCSAFVFAGFAKETGRITDSSWVCYASSEGTTKDEQLFLHDMFWRINDSFLEAIPPC